MSMQLIVSVILILLLFVYVNVNVNLNPSSELIYPNIVSNTDLFAINLFSDYHLIIIVLTIIGIVHLNHNYVWQHKNASAKK
jgi:hypothetical protein